MSDPSWLAAFEGIVISSPTANVVPHPTDTDIVDFERAMHIHLPQSYKAFIKRFGPGGVICEEKQYLLFSPNCTGNSSFDMTRFNREFKSALAKSAVQLTFYTDAKQIGRLVFFSRTPESDFYAWDPEEVTDSQTNEMPVHELLLLGAGTTVVASSFQDFIERYYLRQLAPSHKRNEAEKKSIYTHSFTPAHVTPAGKRALLKSDETKTTRPPNQAKSTKRTKRQKPE